MRAFARPILAFVIGLPIVLALEFAAEHGRADVARMATNFIIGSWAYSVVSDLTSERGS